jgi:hypothetical protein
MSTRRQPFRIAKTCAQARILREIRRGDITPVIPRAAGAQIIKEALDDMNWNGDSILLGDESAVYHPYSSFQYVLLQCGALFREGYFGPT